MKNVLSKINLDSDEVIRPVENFFYCFDFSISNSHFTYYILNYNELSNILLFMKRKFYILHELERCKIILPLDQDFKSFEYFPIILFN